MNTYIALLRGINVGGHKKILMADLRKLLEKLNFKNIKTYIQSGNVVLQSSEEDVTSIESKIKNQILKQYNFEVPVLVKTRKEFNSIIDACPFSEDEKEKSYFLLLYSNPDDELVQITNLISYPNEEFSIAENCIYFYSSIGYGRTKFGNNFFERKLKVSITARNYRTMVKLIEMAS